MMHPTSMGRSGGFRLGLLLLGAVVASACQHPSTQVGSIAAADLAQRVASGKAPVVLDVRTPAEFAAGHIPGAINIPHDELAARLSEIPAAKTTEIVVHCQAGGRAAKAEAVLAQAGYTDVLDLQGHMSGWAQQGLPLKSGK